MRRAGIAELERNWHGQSRGMRQSTVENSYSQWISERVHSYSDSPE